MDESVVQYCGKQLSKCGYCKGTRCSQSHGMHAYVMNVMDYQDLIDRGWRRCGRYCYKPNNEVTCCPLYTIRCDTERFILSKSQKKVLKRMNRFLRDGKREPQETDNGEATVDNVEAMNSCERPEIPDVKLPELKILPQDTPVLNTSTEGQQNDMTPQAETETSDKSSEQITSCLDLNKPPRKKAKQIRQERRQAKLGETEVAPQSKQSVKHIEKTLSDFINDTSPNDKHKLKDLLVPVDSKQFIDTLSQTYSLYKKYQTRIHNDPPENVKSYLEFLQESPLHYEPNFHRSLASLEMGYGSFHQQYWLDNKLIAVGVIDILPTCLSSVYFFYDPDYSFLSLGTYGSLREIELVQRLTLQSPALKYYYMGFYIHSCPKMRYKGKLNFSYLLCPETYIWELLTDDVRAKLDENKYQRFNSDAAAVDNNAFYDSHLHDVKLFVYETRERITYRQHTKQTDNDLRLSLLEYGSHVGKVCAQRMRYLVELK